MRNLWLRRLTVRWSWKRWGLVSLGFCISLAVILTLYKFEWTGFGQGESVSTTTNKRDVDGNIIETTTTSTDPRKNFWDWLSLLGVPLTLIILGYILQQQERNRAEALSREQRQRDERTAQEQREIAANEAKEEILQVYFDRLSTLLIDKNILAIARKVNFATDELQEYDQLETTTTFEERELLDASIDLIRARSLSILRRFGGDHQRINSVIRFLNESDIFEKTKLRFDEADLSKVDLKNTDLKGISLRKANLRGAILSRTDLSKANLEKAYLTGANLERANLVEANLEQALLLRAILSRTYLSGANLSGAYLEGANIEGANLIEANLEKAYLLGAILKRADLEGANLLGAILSRTDLSEANLKNIKWDDGTQWPVSTEVTKAQNIPEALKQQLGLTDTPPTPDPAP